MYQNGSTLIQYPQRSFYNDPREEFRVRRFPVHNIYFPTDSVEKLSPSLYNIPNFHNKNHKHINNKNYNTLLYQNKQKRDPSPIRNHKNHNHNRHHKHTHSYNHEYDHKQEKDYGTSTQMKSATKHKNLKYKTEMCRNFFSTECFCGFGKRCNFIHFRENPESIAIGSIHALKKMGIYNQIYKKKNKKRNKSRLPIFRTLGNN
ncbi:protein tis11 [Anaeramoeba flamelloides]|uniref:Protein tis11 n=1 Tax=Anaeramoeba flamelloides TaxID=1746091 RepID=A0ABQ8YHM9_9EUKA|nr:protein tis11 [Anaeramoeba flamelloides]